MAKLTAGERMQAFLRERIGEAFCAACLGRTLGLTPFDILSYQMHEGWRPFVAIQSAQRVIVPASPSVFREAFPTRAEADEFALEGAREWIDKRP